MLLNRSHLLDGVSETFEGNSSLQCWEKKENDHILYVFSIYFPTEELLTIHWEEAKKYIAAYVQGLLLEKSVERWNLYLFFLVGETVDSQLQYVIEQDKYSTRKVVWDEVGDCPNDDGIVKIISEALFLLDIESMNNCDSDDISSILKTSHSAVFDFLEAHRNDNTKDIFDKMTRLLGQK